MRPPRVAHRPSDVSRCAVRRLRPSVVCEPPSSEQTQMTPNRPTTPSCTPTCADTPMLDTLYRRHAAGLTRWISGMTRDRAAAEDIVSEAFLRLARELAAGRCPDNPPAWVS